MNTKKIGIYAVILILAFWLSITLIFIKKGSNIAIDELERFAINTVLANTENMDCEATDIELREIKYGAFTGPGAQEAFVVCKVNHGGHAYGEDTLACFLIRLKSMEVIRYFDSYADFHSIQYLPTSQKILQLFVVKTVSYTGIYSQECSLISFVNGEYIAKDIKFKEIEEDGHSFVYCTGENSVTIMRSKEYVVHGECVASYVWDKGDNCFKRSEDYYGLGKQ